MVSISTPDAQLNCTGPCPVITATIGNLLPGHDTYKWFNNTILIPGAISSTFTACFPGSYTVNVTNSTSGCEANSSPFVIKPKVIPTVSISTPDAQLNCTGPCPVITATIGNILPGHDTYKWFNNTILIPGAISSTFTACFPGSYTVNVTNRTSGCEANSSPFVIKPKVIPTVSISTPDAQLNCTGPCPVITATIGNILPGHDTYKWFNNTVLIPGAISSTFRPVSQVHIR